MQNYSFFSSTNSALENPETAPSSIENFGYQAMRLYQERLDKRYRERLFQIIADYQYHQWYSKLEPKLVNKKIVLLCQKAGGNGDVAQAFLCAELIRDSFPDCEIKIVIDTPFFDKKEVEKIFPVDRFEVQFLSSADYFKKEKELIQIREEGGCLLGIAVPIVSPELNVPFYRALREYGYGDHPDVKGHYLSMGFAPNEEGINFPIKNNRRLQDLKSEWLKDALDIKFDSHSLKRHLYHIYAPYWVWTIPVLAIYCIAGIDATEAIDVFFPSKYTLNELFEWGVFQREELRKFGIGKLIRITPTDKEIIELGAGKTIQILSTSNLPKEDMETIEQYSEPFFTCTGNMSLSAGFVWNKFILYANIGPERITNFWCSAVAKMESCENLTAFHNLLAKQTKEESEAIRRATPPRKSFYQPEPSVELSEPGSISRKIIPMLSKNLPEYANEIINLYLNTKLLEEAQKFNRHVLKEFDCKPRLLATVCRNLILRSFPDLVTLENNLFQKFKDKTLSEEEVVKELDKELNSIGLLTVDRQSVSERTSAYI